MNANIQGLLNFYSNKELNCLQCKDGTILSSKKAKKYLRWCIANGYKDLDSAPEFDQYMEMMKKK